MPLLDHFHAPLYPQRSWESFHSRWANSIADYLQRILPPRYFAEVQIHLGSQVEADVAEFEGTQEESTNGPVGNLAVQTWAPPAATLVLPAVFPDEVAVQVKDENDDARLVAVVELVSPRNKDRADSRRAFAAKCAAYLQKGIGLVVVDIVTRRLANLHDELVEVMQWDSACRMPDEVSLYAVAYRPVRQGNQNHIQAWPHALTLEAELPLLPLGLRGNGAVPLNIEAAYMDARERSRF